MDEVAQSSENSLSMSHLHRPRSYTNAMMKAESAFKPIVYQLVYYGNVVLDRRITQPMLPWIVEEKRRNDELGHAIILQVSPKGALGISERQGSILFEHHVHNISRFARGRDKKSFGYLWRPESKANFRCFVFKAEGEEVVQNVVSTIREMEKESTPPNPPDESNKELTEDIKELNSNMYEVMYCGKISLNQKRAPPSFIDEAIEKFKEHEMSIQRRKRHFSCDDRARSASDGAQRKSGSVDIVQEGDTKSLSNVNLSSIENIQNNNSNDTTSTGFLDLQKLPFFNNNMVSSGSQDSVDGTGQQSPGKTEASRKLGALPRRDSYTELVTSKEVSQNRTMVFQIGRNTLTVIGLDKRSPILTKKFSEISFCSQGITQPEYFGFICREKSSSQNYMCYVFKCQSESVVDCIMSTLRQSFNAALHHNRLHVICETCPMHQLHKLCQQVEGQSEEAARHCLEHQIAALGASQAIEFTQQLKNYGVSSQEDFNQLAMMFIMRLYEQRQQNHTHISDANNQASNQTNQRTDPGRPANSKLESLKKAKKSLTSSFENLLLRNKNRNGPDRTRTGNEAGEENPGSGLKAVDSSPSGSPCSTPPSQRQAPSPLTSPSSTTSSTVSTSSDATQLTDAPEMEGKPPPHPNAHPHHPHKQVSEDRGPTQGVRTTPMRPRSKTLGDMPKSPCTPSTPVNKGKSAFQFEGEHFKSLRPSSSQRRKPPLLRALSVGGRSNHLSPGDGPRSPFMTPNNRRSWRQAIYNRVVTPMSENKAAPSIFSTGHSMLHSFIHEMKTRAFAEGDENLFAEDAEEGEQQEMTELKPSSAVKAKPKRFHSSIALRALWQRAIREQIILNRMDRENKRIQARQEAVNEMKIKLDYEEITPCLKDVTKEWDKLIALPNRPNTLIPYDDVYRLFKEGVPRTRRGDIWNVLAEQRLLRLSPGSSKIPDSEPYRQLLKQLTTHQHAILIDLGRTYPSHPYFSNPLGRGQLSLFNLLKAYSLQDDEVGYCQGLSFVAGVLLMHLEEQDSFKMLKYLMFSLGFRRQYKPDMTALQIQMYQLSRLLHDFHLRLHDHLEQNEVAPSLYAAPWFLTLFASQFPLGFVSKVFDLIFLQGFEVIFKVALVILGMHEELILQCDGFESIIDFIKNQLPTLGIVQMEKVINMAYSLDISRQLQAYEVEYHVIQEEMLPPSPHSKSMQLDVERLETANHNLRRHNNELLEQLQSAHSVIDLQRSSLHTKQETESKLRSEMRTLKLERSAMLDTIAKLQALIPDNVLNSASIDSLQSSALDRGHESTTLKLDTSTNQALRSGNRGDKMVADDSISFDDDSTNQALRSGSRGDKMVADDSISFDDDSTNQALRTSNRGDKMVADDSISFDDDSIEEMDSDITKISGHQRLRTQSSGSLGSEVSGSTTASEGDLMINGRQGIEH